MHQLVATARVDGRVRQRVVAHLGDFETLDAAIAGCEAQLQKEYARVQDGLARAEAARKHLKAIGWETIPEDKESIVWWARSNWDAKPLRNAIWDVLRTQKRIKPLEERIARLRGAAAACSACESMGAPPLAGTTAQQ